LGDIHPQSDRRAQQTCDEKGRIEMATKLRKLVINEISLVDRGANQHALVTLFKRDAPKEIETPRDSDRNFNATGRGPAHSRLLIAYDNYRRTMGPAQAHRAFETAWADLTDDEKQTIRDEEAATEAAKEAAAAAEQKEREREMMKTMNDSKLEDIVKLAHDVDAGRMGHYADRAAWYGAIAKAAETQRKPNESSQQSFARYVTEDVDGKAMYRCYKTAAGSDYVPPAPEPAPVIKADSAYGRLKKIASNLREARPELKLTEAAAFLKVFTDPVNRELAELSKRESAFA
jgi:hypothetical protein